MPNRIQPIGSGRVSNTTPIQSNVGSALPPSLGVPSHDQFRFKEIELPERDTSQIASQEEPEYAIMLAMFMEILRCGIDIVPQNPKDYGKFVVEASFMPPLSKKSHPVIKAPMRGVIDTLIAPPIMAINNGFQHAVSQQVNAIFNHSTIGDIIRLLVVIAHEFGHALSFLRGFHTKELRYGMELLMTKQATAANGEYTWRVYQEECTAWQYANETLKRYGFDYWPVFQGVKHDSLVTYFKNLQLLNASLDVYYKLSMLGDDFIAHNRDKDDNFDNLQSNSSNNDNV